MVRRYVLAIVTCLCLFAQSRSLFGQFMSSQYVGIPSFSFRAAAQEKDEWCWAASIQMILNHYNIPVTQEMIVQQAKGGLVDQGGSDEDISRSLNGWVPGINGQTLVVSSIAAAGPPPPTVLIDQLSHGHPMLLTFATGPSSGHAVVITAASYTPSAYGPLIRTLIIRDPWPSPQNIQTSGKVELAGDTLSDFLPNVRSHWLVSVTAGSSGLASGYGPRPKSVSDDSPDSGDLCTDLSAYVTAAAQRFSSFRKDRLSTSSDLAAYQPKQGISDLKDCEIEFYSDHTLSPSARCDVSDKVFDDFWTSVHSCLGDDTKVRQRSLSAGEESKVSLDNGVTVRLRSNHDKIRLWIDAPDRSE